MSKYYKDDLDFFNRFTPKHMEGRVDKEHIDELHKTYDFLEAEAFIALNEYYNEAPDLKGKDLIKYKQYQTRWNNGELKPLALFNQLTRLGYNPKISI